MFSFLFKKQQPSSVVSVPQVEEVVFHLPSREEFYSKAVEEAQDKLARMEISHLLFKEVYGEEVFNETLAAIQNYGSYMEVAVKYPKAVIYRGYPRMYIDHEKLLDHLVKKMKDSWDNAIINSEDK